MPVPQARRGNSFIDKVMNLKNYGVQTFPALDWQEQGVVERPAFQESDISRQMDNVGMSMAEAAYQASLPVDQSRPVLPERVSYDDLDFGHAFNKAFTDIGEGGTFDWQGKKYLLKRAGAQAPASTPAQVSGPPAFANQPLPPAVDISQYGNAMAGGYGPTIPTGPAPEEGVQDITPEQAAEWFRIGGNFTQSTPHTVRPGPDFTDRPGENMLGRFAMSLLGRAIGHGRW